MVQHKYYKFNFVCADNVRFFHITRESRENLPISKISWRTCWSWSMATIPL